MLRGGNWNNGANAGPFCANLNNAPRIRTTTLAFAAAIVQKPDSYLYGDNEQCNETTSIQIQAVKPNTKSKTSG